jgi:hypothetical protein
MAQSRWLPCLNGSSPSSATSSWQTKSSNYLKKWWCPGHFGVNIRARMFCDQFGDLLFSTKPEPARIENARRFSHRERPDALINPDEERDGTRYQLISSAYG